MRTLAIASAKGGCGKTTITAALAVQAMRDGANVAMMDLNEDQGNLTQWWQVRDSPMNPMLIQNLKNIPRDVKEAAKKYDFLLIDTPPTEIDLIHQAVVVADAVLIPVRASMFDVAACETVVDLAKKHSKPWAFVLSAIDSRFKSLNTQATTALAQIATRRKGRILGGQVSHRMQYVQALHRGKTGAEVDADCENEIKTLWSQCLSDDMLGGE